VEIQSQVSINGTDITNLIAEGGIKWTRNDLDGPNAGRTLSGLMIRDRVAVKIKLQITCRDLSGTELTGLLNLIYPVFVSVTYDDPLFGTVTKTMYSNNNAATLRNIDTNEKRVWSDISFPLIEQ
jgi:hypothetical protein